MIRLRATPAPEGGAVKLEILTTATTLDVLILASPNPAIPDPDEPGDTREVHRGPLYRRHKDNLTYGVDDGFIYPVLDLESSSLPDDVPVHYHLFDLSKHPREHTTASVVPRCTMMTTIRLIRHLVRQRIDYHIQRGVQTSTLNISNEFVDVLDSESWHTGISMPIILLKETATADPSGDTIGKGQVQRDGAMQRQSLYHVRVDITSVSDNKTERDMLGKFLHEAAEADMMLYHQAGLMELRLSRFDRTLMSEGSDAQLYYSELTLEASMYVTTRERLDVAPPEPEEPVISNHCM